MLPTSGTPWVDLVVTLGAVVAALAVIYTKVIKPIVHAAQRVNGIFDLADDLPPSVTAVLLQLPAKVQEIHDRIDDHMNREETSFDDLSTELNDLSETMQASHQALTEHIANDDARFQASATALGEGQAKLLARLNQIASEDADRRNA